MIQNSDWIWLVDQIRAERFGLGRIGDVDDRCHFKLPINQHRPYLSRVGVVLGSSGRSVFEDDEQRVFWIGHGGL